MSEPENPAAFPCTGEGFGNPHYTQHGMTLRDYFAGQALANTTLCNGEATHWQINHWFGTERVYTRAEVVAKQAAAVADAMLAERAKP